MQNEAIDHSLIEPSAATFPEQKGNFINRSNVL